MIPWSLENPDAWESLIESFNAMLPVEEGWPAMELRIKGLA